MMMIMMMTMTLSSVPSTVHVFVHHFPPYFRGTQTSPLLSCFEFVTLFCIYLPVCVNILQYYLLQYACTVYYFYIPVFHSYPTALFLHQKFLSMGFRPAQVYNIFFNKEVYYRFYRLSPPNSAFRITYFVIFNTITMDSLSYIQRKTRLMRCSCCISHLKCWSFSKVSTTPVF
jgi:hypothetical protein